MENIDFSALTSWEIFSLINKLNWELLKRNWIWLVGIILLYLVGEYMSRRGK